MSDRPEVDGWAVYRRLISYVRGDWRRFGVAAFGMVLYAGADTSFAWLMKPMLNGSFVERDEATLQWVPLAILAVFVVRGIGSFLSAYNMSWIGWRLISRLRAQVFDQYLHLPSSYFDRVQSGELISRITFNTNSVASAATDSLTVLVRDSLTVIGLLGLMFYHSWQLSLTFLLLGPAIAWIVKFVTKRFRRLGHEIQDSVADLTHSIQEGVDGQKVVKIFQGHDQVRERFEQLNQHNRQLNMREVATKAFVSPIMQFMVAIALAAIVHMATASTWTEEISVGAFMSFITAMLMLFQPLRALSNVNASLQRGIAASASLFEILDEAREQDGGKGKLPKAPKRLSFEAVDFSYPNHEAKVLDQVSFSLERNTTLALVGESGSGKSTIVHLLSRYYMPSGGKICIDGVSHEDITLRSLRQGIAYVGQDVMLFDDTVANNIAFGGAQGASQKAIEQAAKAANAHDFIQALPEGYATRIGERGGLLSGGQRQRIAIARALLKDAPILILDEATSALDNESERKVQQALQNLMHNRMTLVIAHRLSTIENADQILVMSQGRIIESGQHQSLMASAGAYAKLHQQLATEDDSTRAQAPANDD